MRRANACLRKFKNEPMKRPRRSFNRKRIIRKANSTEDRESLVKRVSYGGNPEHKRNPGDFGLVPPARPRPDKTLCDEVGVLTRIEATALLKDGMRKGLISEQERGSFPQNVWAVTSEGEPVEAQLENSAQGIYHGYPMPESDPLRAVVLERWKTAAV